MNVMEETRIKIIGTNGEFNILSSEVLQNVINEFLANKENAGDIKITIQEVTNYNKRYSYDKCLIGIIQYNIITTY